MLTKSAISSLRRMTSSLEVTILSDPIFEYFTLYTCKESWRGGHGPQLWIERSQVEILVAMVWHCVLGHDTSPICALSQPSPE